MFYPCSYSLLKFFFSVQANGEEVAIDKNNLLLRGCVLKNTESLYGLVIYAGKYFFHLHCFAVLREKTLANQFCYLNKWLKFFLISNDLELYFFHRNSLC